MEKIRAEQQTSSTTLQTLSNSIHSREMDLAKKKQELKDKDALEQTQKDAREEIIKLETQTKVRRVVTVRVVRLLTRKLFRAGP